ncbi:OmpA family protein [Algiphilus sp.]|uniref:OmpA family protein n=1 Tax=Algiphilus sp. TaxID=1872431 RepID=UPI003C415CAC
MMRWCEFFSSSRSLLLPMALIAGLMPPALAQAAGEHYSDGHGGEVFFPMGAVSFADEVSRFDAGDPAADDAQYSEAERALDAPRYAEDKDDFVTLGCAGGLVLRFTDNQLIDVPGPDLYVFEIGPDTEPTALAVSPDGEAWTRVGTIAGGKAEIDLAPYVAADDSFRYVKLVDLKQACDSGTPGADVDAVGAIGSATSIALDSAVLFDSGAHRLKPGAFEALDTVIAEIGDPASSQVEVAGHTDGVGDARDNLALSRRRARAVADHLVENGDFAVDAVTTRAFGEARPVADNDTAEGRARNRRVELTVRATRTAEAGPPRVEILGVWGGTSGRSADRVVELRREGDRIRGDYDFDGSRVLGGFTDATTFEGFWIKQRSGQKCDSARDGSHYWGHLRLEFGGPARNRFDGLWRYCGSAEDDWSPKGWRNIERLL